ncbi:flagellar hook-associated protein FlgK [Chitinimonas arctica]|uniref:Flagellar hook-associated protein 1 n=1 Tax=Chitinimonas arctica TaxID=2594795 RepID=A0A516SL16_9NEIS|nr:flagellar hook-associated protein FlgK [Chitinimonas arctica]QDQ28852.1 flagellar hook-associated protein FlgK [Chitinimonas arctica]
MGNGIYGIAVSGLKAAQIGLTATSHNIANASTPGYNRQQITQSAVEPTPTGGGFLGRGVGVDTITRVYNEFVARQVQTAQAQDGYLTNLQSHLADLDNLLADPSAGFSPSLQDFFTGVQTVANNPQNVPARQSLIGLAESMITKLKTVNERMAILRKDVNTEITASVGSINAITNQIANLNDQIILAAGTAGGNPPNDLLDKRDQLVKDLNKYVKSTVIKQSDGSYNIFVGNGQNLVVGNQAFTLGAVQAKDDASRFDVAYQQFGNTVVIPSELITGGSLGGVLEFRKDVLDVTQNSLGRVGIALAQVVNDQHRMGQDLNGQYGGNFFQFPVETINVQPRVGANQVTLSAQLTSAQPFIESDFNVALDNTGTNYTITRLTDGQTASISLASGQLTSPTGFVAFGVRFKLETNPNVLPPTGPNLVAGENFGVSFLPAASNVLAHADNTGDADLQVSIGSSNQLTTSDYELIYDGPDYRVVRKEDGATFNINAAAWGNPPVQVDGMLFRINSGTIQPGDRYTVQPSRDFADNMSVMIKDTAKIAAATPIRTSSDTFSIVTSANAANTGTGAITRVSASIAAQGGSAAKRIEIVFTGAASYDIRDSVSGTVLVANQTYIPGSNINYNGWNVQVSGAPNTGDRFVVDPRKNAGSATISSGTVSTVPININLKVPVAVRFNSPATTYDLVDPATGTVLTNPSTGLPMSNQAYTSGANITFNGWTTQVSGIPAGGDTFVIESNTGGKADARNMLAIGLLQTASSMVNGTTSFQGAYSKMVADVGVRSNKVNINQAAQAQLLTQAETKFSESSGVNLDEEASNLLIFQQAYLASSRVIQIAQKAFEEVLNIGR